MPYTVKLKNQIGSEVNYGSIERIAVPLASGTGNAYFMARYDVKHVAVSNITYSGGEYAAHAVDYACRITSTGALPNAVTVTIGGETQQKDVGYTYSKEPTCGHIVIKGAYITGNIVITASA